MGKEKSGETTKCKGKGKAKKNKNDNDFDVICIYCSGLHSESADEVEWIKCATCDDWAHTDCAVAENDYQKFTWDLCTV